MYAFYFCCDLNKLLINNDSVSVLGNRENAQGTKFGNFLENYFWPPPLQSILYMDLTESVLTYPNLWPQRSAP